MKRTVGRTPPPVICLGDARHVADIPAEDPLSSAALAAVMTAMRHRIEAALGAAASAAAQTAGGQLPVPALLDLALDGLAG